MKHSPEYTKAMRRTKLKTDRVFLQEIINAAVKEHGVRSGKAFDLLRDWSRELRDKSGLKGRTKQYHAKHVGRYLYYP